MVRAGRRRRPGQSSRPSRPNSFSSSTTSPDAGRTSELTGRRLAGACRPRRCRHQAARPWLPQAPQLAESALAGSARRQWTGYCCPASGPGPVPPAFVEHRGGDVSLGDPGADLLEQLLLERARRCEVSLGIIILGLEIGDDCVVVLVGEPLPVVWPGCRRERRGRRACGAQPGMGKVGGGA